MLIKFICCDVFARIACDLIAKSPHVIDVEFLPMLAHDEPKKLNAMIRDRIGRLDDAGRPYDAVLLGFGLCGNAVIGLDCPIPMVIPRAHDCCAIHMGGRERFLSAFGDKLSARWCSTGYYERCIGLGGSHLAAERYSVYKTSAEYMGYVERFGEEDAQYIWETMHPDIEADEAVYIKIDGYEYSNAHENYLSYIEEAGKRLLTVSGEASMLRALIFGEWNDEQFLTLPPGKRIAGVYDMERVMMAANSAGG